MEQAIGFSSDGFALKGVLHVPEGAARPRPAIILCHGFGGSCRGAGHPELAQALARAGYVVLRFDFRGCGQSEGARGSVICLEEVSDLFHAIDFLETQVEVDRDRIGVIGASLGGSVAIYAAAKDRRLKFCAANGAIGKGERRFRFQYRDETAWQAFLKRLDEAKRVKAETSRSAMLGRFDIVFIPESNRAGLPPGAVMEFTAETAMSMLDFNPEDVIAEIAPRPLLLIHPRVDAVVPCSETEAMAKAADETCEA
ncbi:MAG TPA: alpha/beta fold hydrolase, partial [Stellaceae bacterium]|nr:alpha/beta fold hydrolase [Stellaceae bacterium]